MVRLSLLTLSESLNSIGNYYGTDFGDDNYTVTYYLKGGIKVKRSYALSKPEKIDFLKTPEYYENYQPIFTFDSKYLDKVWVYSSKYDTDFNKKDGQKLLEVLREDIRKYGIIDAKKTIEVEFVFSDDTNYEYHSSYFQSFEVPLEYEATAQVIKEAAQKYQ